MPFPYLGVNCQGLTVASLFMGIFTIDRDLPSTEDDQRIDVAGTFLATAGLVLIVFVLTQGELAPQQWKTPCRFILPKSID